MYLVLLSIISYERELVYSGARVFNILCCLYKNIKYDCDISEAPIEILLKMSEPVTLYDTQQPILYADVRY